MFNKPLEEIKKAEQIPLGQLKERLRYLPSKSFTTDDGNLMKFLYSRRLCVDTTFTLIKNHLKYREDHPEIFENLSIGDPGIKCALQNSLPELHPQIDRKCRTIIIFHANNWSEEISLKSIYRAFILCLDFALQNVHVQNNGFVIIVNWEQFPFRKSLWLNPKFINDMIYGVQECYPAKFLELHFVAPSWYITGAFGLFKQFFNDDIKDNFFTHGRNLTTLHDFIHKDVLPSELGGSLPSYNSNKLIQDLENFCEQ